MDKLSRAFAAVIGLAFPLMASAQVFFCQMTEFVMIDTDGSNKLTNQRFIMKVLPNAVSFKSDGYFQNTRASVDLWRGYGEWSATTVNALTYVDSVYRFGDGILNVSAVFQKQITSIRAECEEDQ